MGVSTRPAGVPHPSGATSCREAAPRTFLLIRRGRCLPQTPTNSPTTVSPTSISPTTLAPSSVAPTSPSASPTIRATVTPTVTSYPTSAPTATPPVMVPVSMGVKLVTQATQAQVRPTVSSFRVELKVVFLVVTRAQPQQGWP
jgi:hypothetical protein